jgi:hypothetical protein
MIFSSRWYDVWLRDPDILHAQKQLIMLYVEGEGEG